MQTFMLKTTLLITLGLILSFQFTYAQTQPTSEEQLKQEILSMKADIEQINLNLEKSKSKFQVGVLVATLGYSITITGGLMLGRENDDLGQALLVAGGITGGIGTVLLVDSFKYLGRTRRKPK